jgi:hypothetical protein
MKTEHGGGLLALPHKGLVGEYRVASDGNFN